MKCSDINFSICLLSVFYAESFFLEDHSVPNSGPAPHPCGRRCSRYRVIRLPSSGCSAQCPKDGYHSMAARPLLAAFRFATLSSSVPGQPPLALRVVSCWAAIRQLGKESRPGRSLHSHPDLPGVRRLAPHTARDLGRTLRQVRSKNHRPTPPGVPPTAGNEQQRMKPTAPPGHLPPLAWVMR